MTRPKALFFAAHLALGISLIGGTARADREDWNSGRALVLFRLARVDLEAGRYAEALAKFSDSQALDPGAGTLLNMAFCHAKLGKVATAWSEYNAAAVLAREQAKPDWERDALEQAARLDRSLPRVVIRVQEPVDGEWPEVLLDKTPLPRSLWGEATPVDPGPHEVLATAVAKRTWSKTFEVDRERGPTVTVPLLEPAGPRVPAPAPGGAAVGAATDPASKNAPNEGPRFWMPRKTAALALGGAGVMAVGLGGALALVAKSTFASASSDCTVAGCGPRGADQQSRAYREAGSASVATAVGGALLFDAVLVWLTGSSPPSGPRLQPALASTSCGASITGTW
ncbi:MAG: tetratricopeptide repeat protein [Myxococcota bacterium]|nr:tetratricopeptide repeat protein [Myxococcota bacterium]